MIQSLFILSPTGEVLIERHFRSSLTSRSVCDVFWSRASEGLNHHGGVSTSTSLGSTPFPLYDSVPPVMEVPDVGHLDDYCDEGGTGGGGGGKGAPHHHGGGSGSLYLYSVLRDGLTYLAASPACMGGGGGGGDGGRHGGFEVPPLLVVEFLHRIADTFVLYFGDPADESAVKDNFSTAYQLLEEMVDHGWPLTTEPNALTDLIRPPTVTAKLYQAISGGASSTLSEALPTGTVSNMPWRKAQVTHPNNEIYIDIIEEIDATISPSGGVLSSDVAGRIRAQSNLSGVPDLLLTFNDPSLIDDCSFHPCVRYTRFDRDEVVSFVPPDGPFELMRYRVSSGGGRRRSGDGSNRHRSNVTVESMPIQVIPRVSYGQSLGGGERGGTISLSVSARSISSLVHSSSRRGPLVVDDVTVVVPFPKFVRTVNLNVTEGQVIYDEAGRIAKWTVGQIDEKKRPQLNGTMVLEEGEEMMTSSMSVTGEEQPPVLVNWKVLLASVSGLNVSGLSVTGEHYKPFKGVRNITKSGTFQIRCH